jgi:hypothetical protein
MANINTNKLDRKCEKIEKGLKVLILPERMKMMRSSVSRRGRPVTKKYVSVVYGTELNDD